MCVYWRVWFVGSSLSLFFFLVFFFFHSLLLLHIGLSLQRPNISASIPQLNAAIAELQAKGYKIPNFPQNPKTAEEEDAYARYSKALGSAVNPVIREGNSDRRVADPVKKHAQRSRPPVKMQPYPKGSTSHVAHMSKGDFYGSELSTTIGADGAVVSIEFTGADGSKKVLKKDLKLLPGEVIDASTMSRNALRTFFAEQFAEAKKSNIMVSLHLKATMMKISDPIIFGHAVSVLLSKVFEKHAATFKQYNVNPNNGLGDVLAKVNAMPEAVAKPIKADIEAARAAGPDWAMVDSAKGITNLHVPNDVIIDASMPPLIRDGGKMWNKDNQLADTKALIPDRSYASIYAAIMKDCKTHGQFDHSTMGSVANVGLMAQKAEEYGSHDKTFEIPSDGTVRVLDAKGKVIFEHTVEKGDIWRMCQTKDEPIRDWVRLAVVRARASKNPAIFWLDADRAHDAQLINKVRTYLKDHDTEGLELVIMAPADAMTYTCARARARLNTISVTGNVLRDYLTDLFPILELGTSAKMLSIVPLLKGGGLFETGAGGSAPKHVEQFQKENHLRWDSLGEYLAVAVSLEHMALVSKLKEPALLSETLNIAVEKLLKYDKSPSRKAKEIDNRGSTFYIARYWAEELAKKDKQFAALAEALIRNEEKIASDLVLCQGASVDYGGYFMPDDKKAAAVMRPSKTFNDIIDSPVSAKL